MSAVLEDLSPLTDQDTTETQAPFWTKIGKDGRAGGLDLHSVLCLDKGKNQPGDIAALEQLIDKASAAGLSLIGMNPVGDTGDLACSYCGRGLSSYNPAHIALDIVPGLDDSDEKFVELRQARAEERAGEDQTLFNHQNIRKYNLAALKIKYEKLTEDEQTDFKTWTETCPKGTLNYAVFSALKQRFGESTPWQKWPEEFKHKDSKELIANDPYLGEKTNFILYTQYIAEQQWTDVNEYAAKKGVYLSMDKPIYPQVDSADVWANPELFHLWEEGPEKDQPKYVSGVNVPGDPYGAQKWGHAVYKFEEKPEEVIDSFIENIRHMTKVSKVVRLDHALALIWKFFTIPAKYPAEDGRYRDALKEKLLGRLKQEFPDVYFYAEDIGYVSEEEVDKPLGLLGIPGMRMPMLDPNNPRYAKAEAYPRGILAATDNHDTAAISEWWKALSFGERGNILEKIYEGENIIEKLDQPLNIADYIRWVFKSNAVIAMTTFRAATGDNRRYNVPGQGAPEFWQLLSAVALEQLDLAQLKQIIEETGRKALSVAEMAQRNSILATRPGLEELQRRKPGETIDLDFATAQEVTEIKFSCSQIADNPTGNWEETILTPENPQVETLKYADGTIIYRLKMPTTVDVPEGTYEFASSVTLADSTVHHLTTPGNNFKFKIQ